MQSFHGRETNHRLCYRSVLRAFCRKAWDSKVLLWIVGVHWNSWLTSTLVPCRGIDEKRLTWLRHLLTPGQGSCLWIPSTDRYLGLMSHPSPWFSNCQLRQLLAQCFGFCKSHYGETSSLHSLYRESRCLSWRLWSPHGSRCSKMWYSKAGRNSPCKSILWILCVLPHYFT